MIVRAEPADAAVMRRVTSLTPDHKPMSERSSVFERYALVVAAAGAYGSLMFVWFSLPAYLPTVIAEVGLTGTEAGILAGAVPLTYIPLGILTGLVVDRLGAGRSITVGLLVFGLAQFGRSAAPGFLSLLAFTLLLGVGGTAITFGIPKLVGECFPAGRTGPPTSLYLVGASAGSAAVFAVGRPVLGPMLGGWRPLFYWSGLAVVAYAVVWFVLTALASVDVDATGDTGFDRAAIGRDLRTLFAHRDLRLVVVVATMYLMIAHGLQGWLPTVLEARGLPPGPAGQTTSLFVAGTVVAVLVVPSLADRFDARRPAIVGSGLVGFVGLVSVVAGETGPLVVAGVALAGMGVGGISPLVRAIPPDLDDVGPRLTGTAMGFAFAVGEIGGFSGPFLVGALYDLTGSYAFGLTLLAVGGLVVVGAGLAMRDV